MLRRYRLKLSYSWAYFSAVLMFTTRWCSLSIYNVTFIYQFSLIMKQFIK